MPLQPPCPPNPAPSSLGAPSSRHPLLPAGHVHLLPCLKHCSPPHPPLPGRCPPAAQCQSSFLRRPLCGTRCPHLTPRAGPVPAAPTPVPAGLPTGHRGACTEHGSVPCSWLSADAGRLSEEPRSVLLSPLLPVPSQPWRVSVQERKGCGAQELGVFLSPAPPCTCLGRVLPPPSEEFGAEDSLPGGQCARVLPKHKATSCPQAPGQEFRNCPQHRSCPQAGKERRALCW